MHKTQIVISEKPEYLSPNALHYILAEQDYALLLGDALRDKYSVFEYPLRSDEEYIISETHIHDLTERMIQAYYPAINKTCGIDMDFQQWWMVISIMLREMLFSAYWVYKKLKTVDPENAFIVSGKGCPLHGRHFFGPIRENDLQNSYLWVCVAKEMGIPVIYIDRVWQPLNGGIYNQLAVSDSLYKRMKRLLLWVRDKYCIRLFSPRSQVVLSSTNFSGEEEAVFIKQSRGRVGRISIELFRRESNRIIGKYERDIEARERVFGNSFEYQNEFERIAHVLFLNYAPVTYFEAARELYEKALFLSKSWNYKKIFTTQSRVELAAFCFALAQKKGAEIFGCQHAHQYGVALMTPIGDMFCSDHYVTWGWEEDNVLYRKHSIVPLGRARKLGFNESVVKQKGKILYVTSTHGPSTVDEGVIYERYLTNEITFLDKLNKDIRERIVLRVKLKAADGRDVLADLCQKRYPEIRIETNADIGFSESVQESDFVICDYLGTPELDVMMLGVPLILFRCEDLFVLNKRYLCIIEKFRNAGIYASTVNDMVGIVKRCSDSHEWLFDRSIQDLYREYLREFAGSDLLLKEGFEEEVGNKYFSEFLR